MNLSDRVPTEESCLPGPGGNLGAAHAAQTHGFLSLPGAKSQLSGNITGVPRAVRHVPLEIPCEHRRFEWPFDFKIFSLVRKYFIQCCGTIVKMIGRSSKHTVRR